MAGSLVSKRFGLLGATTALLGLAAGIGCPDPEKMFGEFEDRTKDMRVVPEPPPVGNGIVDMTGTYTFAISTTISPEQPLMLLGRATMTIDPADGTGVLNLSIQPVVPDPKPLAECPEPGTFVGEPIVLDGIQVSDTGAFSANFGEVHVEGCGNGISGSEIVANLQLDGITLSEFRMCGNVTGALSQPFPFDLTGSKWGAVDLNREVPADATTVVLGDPDYSCDQGGGGAGGAGGAGGTGGAGGAGGTGGAGGN